MGAGPSRECGVRKMTEDRINEKNLIEKLREAFPELEHRYRERVDDYKGERVPSNYTVVGFVLQPQLEEEVAKGERSDFLRRAALFIERVCSSGDPEAINVIWIKIFEWLIFRPKELRVMWPILGPATKENIKDAASRWSKAGRHFGHIQGMPDENLPKE